MNETDVKILRSLMEKPKTFIELLNELKISRPTLTEHLKKLEEREIIESFLDKKDKRRVYYRVASNSLLIASPKMLVDFIKNQIELNEDEEKELEELFKSEDVKTYFKRLFDIKGFKIDETNEMIDFLDAIAIYRSFLNVLDKAWGKGAWRPLYLEAISMLAEKSLPKEQLPLHEPLFMIAEKCPLWFAERWRGKVRGSISFKFGMFPDIFNALITIDKRQREKNAQD